MRQALFGIPLLALTVSVLAAPGPMAPDGLAPSATARGKGSYHFGVDNSGVGYFKFEVIDGTPVTGSLLFAGEAHDHFPDIIVRVETINSLEFNSERLITFKGPGQLHHDDVNVMVNAYDGSGTNEKDWIHVHVTDPDGNVLVHAIGELFLGDIVVGEPQ